MRPGQLPGSGYDAAIALASRSGETPGGLRRRLLTDFVDRPRELAELDRYLAAVREGHPLTVAVHGGVGLGKSSLLEHFLTLHQDVQVLRATAAEWERDDRYGVARRLMGEDARLRLGVERLPTAADGPSQVADTLTRLWTRLARQRVLIVAIDDAHWCDEASLQAITSAGRRLAGTHARVLLLVLLQDDVARGQSHDLLGRLAEYHLAVTPWRTREVGAYAARRGILLSLPAARRLAEHSAGRPSVVRELLTEQPPDFWRERHDLLPAPHAMTYAVSRVLESVSPPARRLAEAAAVLGQRSPLAEAARLADLDDPIPSFDELHRHGLVMVSDVQGVAEVAVTDSLTRAAIYAAIGPLRRRVLHRSAAEVALAEADRLWHRTLADPFPDAGVADALYHCARRQSRAGQWSGAARSYLQSARICPDQAESDRRYLLSVEAMIGAGEVPEAVDLTPEVESRPPGPLRDSLLGYLAVVRGRATEAGRYLTRAWEQVDEGADPELAALIARHRVVDSLGHWNGEQIIDWGRRALALDRRGAAAVEAAAILGLGYATTGRIARAADLYDDSLAALGTSAQWQRALMAQGWLELATDRPAEARRSLESAAPTVQRGGSYRISVWARGWLARAELQLGDWDAAIRSVEEAQALLDQSGMDLLRPLVHWTGAQIWSLRGRPDIAEPYLRAIEGRIHDYAVMAIPARLARAQYAESLADYDTVVRTLAPLAAMPPDHDMNEPGFWPWQDVYANALALAGHLDEAADFLPHHEAWARERASVSSMARLGYARARLYAARGEVADAQAQLERSLELLSGLPLPYDRSRVLFVYGQTLRRAGKRRQADGMLQEARAGFASLGAQAYVDRCDRELKAGGVGVRREIASFSELTPQERIVAALVAEGRSNKDVALELYLSVKTVQFHLTRVYAKLGVRSRAELAARFREAQDGP